MRALLVTAGLAIVSTDSIGAGEPVCGTFGDLPQDSCGICRAALADLDVDLVTAHSNTDSVTVLLIECPAGCPSECEAVPDGNVNVGDFLAMLARWARSARRATTASELPASGSRSSCTSWPSGGPASDAGPV